MIVILVKQCFFQDYETKDTLLRVQILSIQAKWFECQVKKDTFAKLENLFKQMG